MKGLVPGLAAAIAAAAASPLAAAEPASGSLEAAMVTMGPDGQATARVVTRAAACPTLTVDGVARPMAVRARPGSEPLRPTRSTPENSKPSAFPVLVCDAAIPAHASIAAVADRPMPLPPARVRRIVVIGDTGCRLKASDRAWQACNDPAAYPFARIAAEAARTKPDLVIHVGDYLYRENPCPAGNKGCAGSPWGYGWDAWQADFFAPARPLLQAAPWVVVRGNHESCARAGQGWWRLLDSRPLEPRRDCNDPGSDPAGDASPAYAVPLGGGTQVVVMDLSAAGTAPLAPDDPRREVFRQTARDLARLSRAADFTFAADHYPLFGVTAEHGTLEAGNPALQAAFAMEDRQIVPPAVDVLLAGHVHVWEHVDFAGRQPSQFVAGFSGTREEIVPLPAVLPAGMTPAPDAPVRQFNAIIDRFGFMTLKRAGRSTWRAVVHAADGRVIERCRIERRHSICAAVGVGRGRPVPSPSPRYRP